MTVLKLGSKGEGVAKLQKDLNELKVTSFKLLEDGNFGPKTDAAVRAFQKSAFLNVDGVAGPMTLAKIKVLLLGDQDTNVINDVIVGNIAEVNIYKNDKYLWFISKAAIDADGGIKTYGPNGIGMDYLANAGYPGNWWALVTSNGKTSGTPIIQGPNDPAPGYYISMTSLQYPQYLRTDPRRYVDSLNIPFYVLPANKYSSWGIKLGQKAILTNKANGKSCEAIFADAGPSTKIGEISIKAAELLGLPSNPKNGGTDSKIIEYKVIL